MVSGNFAGDTSDDVAAVYAYANNAKVFVFESTSNLFNDGWVTVHDGKGSYLKTGVGSMSWQIKLKHRTVIV